MVFQPFHFENIKPQTLGLSDALQNALSSYQQGYQLAQMPQQTELKNALMQAQINKAQRPPGMTGAYGKALADLDLIKKQYGENSPQYKLGQQNLQRIAEGPQGVTMYDPKTGLPVLQVGGSKGGRGGNQQYITDDGTIVTPATQSQKSRAQAAITGSQIVENFAPDLKKLAKFQSPSAQISKYAQALSNKFLGTQYPLPSEEAEGIAGMLSMSEAMLKEMNLNATNEALTKVQKIIEPIYGEAEQPYLERVARQLDKFQKGARDQAKTQAYGYRFNPKGQEDSKPSSQGSNDTVLIKNSEGRYFEVPKNRVAHVLAGGGQRV